MPFSSAKALTALQQMANTSLTVFIRNDWSVGEEPVANNFCSAFRGETVCLHHVWHAVFPTLPPSETQPHPYGYEPSFLTPLHWCNRLHRCYASIKPFHTHPPPAFCSFCVRSVTRWLNVVKWHFVFPLLLTSILWIIFFASAEWQFWQIAAFLCFLL